MEPALRPKPRGGKRPGSGRPARRAIASEPHRTRPEHDRRYPVHVVARAVAGARSFTTTVARDSIARAMASSLGHTEFRIVYLAILADRLELIVEAFDRASLVRGVQGFQVAVARILNHALRPKRRGSMFADRYRTESLRTLLAVERVLSTFPATTRASSPQTWLLQAIAARRG